MNIREIMKLQSEVMFEIRDFFKTNNFLEADVPILSRKVIPEAPIELFKTSQISLYNNNQDFFLLPSPEYYLKKLIAKGSGSIFCLSKSFRNSEQTGSWHNPEFTMLEYYAIEANYMNSAAITEKLFARLLEKRDNPKLEPPFKKMSMTEVFDKYTGFDLSGHCTGAIEPNEEIQELVRLAKTYNLQADASDSWEELFNLIFVHQIEPQLPKNKPLIIYDYPSAIPALAKQAKTPGRLERWELYAGGVEIANCYSEETNYNRVTSFFRQEKEQKKDALVKVEEDMDWCEMYKAQYPICSGTAMGVERLLMILSGKTSIEGVILFPLSDRIN